MSIKVRDNDNHCKRLIELFQIFRAYKWTRISILTRDFGLCLYGGTSVYTEAQISGDFEVVEYNIVKPGIPDVELLRYLRNFQERARGNGRKSVISVHC